MEIQDLACEIAALSPSFPVRAAPFTVNELVARLPLSFNISPVITTDRESESQTLESKMTELTVLINEVKSRQTAQKDVGFGKYMLCFT